MVHLFVCSVWKPKDRSPGRLKIRQEVTKYNLTDVTQAFVADYSGSGKGLMVDSYEHRYENPDSVKLGKFLDYL